MKIILKLPKLFIISNGKKRFWEIWIEEHFLKNKNEKIYYIVRNYGIIGGKLTIPEKKEVKSMSKGITEVRMLWRKKIESGFQEDEKMVKTKGEMVKPMGAYKLDEYYNKIKYPACVQRKLDGFRCISQVNKNQEVIMYSRGMKPFIFLEHIKREIKKIKELIKSEYIYLDGELYEKDLSLHQISSLIMKKYATTEQIKEMEKVSYYIFDMFDLKDLTLTYKERYSNLNKIFKKYKFKYLKLVTCEMVNNFEKIKELDQEYILDGFEGVIVRNMDGIYKLNSKSYDVLRTKEFKKKDFIIIGAKQGVGQQKGAILWNLQCLKNKNNNFWAIPIGSIKTRINDYKKYTKNPDKYIGKKAIVKYIDISNEGCITRNPIVQEIIL
jgi:ATP-dependent DNA ligase